MTDAFKPIPAMLNPEQPGPTREAVRVLCHSRTSGKKVTLQFEGTNRFTSKHFVLLSTRPPNARRWTILDLAELPWRGAGPDTLLVHEADS